MRATTKQLLAQSDRQEVRSISNEETHRMITSLTDAAVEAHNAGDQAASAACVEALDRMQDGEDVQTVYSQWLRSQRPAQAGGGTTPGSGPGR
jgi:hypothetical protein